MNKLMNVAKYLNDGWEPNWLGTEIKWEIFVDINYNTIQYISAAPYCRMSIYFKTQELAEQAVEILGENVIRLALSTDY